MPERRRGAALERALLDAAWAELVERGYANFTMDAVVARAGTSPPVLYRRWSNRQELLRAAIAHAAQRDLIKVPDAGSLRGDMLALLRHVNATRTDLAAVMSVHLGEYYQETGTSPADLRDLLLAGQPDPLDAIYRRAVARGEIDPERLTEKMKRLPIDLLRAEFLMVLQPLPDTAIVEIVDTIFMPLVRLPTTGIRD
ncbi:TetR/AcrR family transcriptional regulator [Streptomyces hebeiensis]|uniref:TetR/AcrR family transcriptional regulator n=1 Tax=Streptomyces hebeiensis TaxID=229486 RepID=A0ABN1UYG6_9ACTN